MEPDPPAPRSEPPLSFGAERVQALLDSSLAPIIIEDERGNTAGCNHQLQGHLGVPEGEAWGRPFAEVIARVRAHFDDPEAFDRLVARSMAADVPPPDFAPDQYLANVLRLRGPEDRWVAVFATPVRDRAGRHMGRFWTFPDLTRFVRAGDALHARLRYEEAIATCAQTLLAGDERADPLPEALGHLLRAAEADRVYLAENCDLPGAGLATRNTHLVTSDAGAVRDPASVPTVVPYSVVPRWREALAAGTPIGGVVAELPPDERALLEPQGVRAVLALPMRAAGRWCGFVGFATVARAEAWGAEDARMLQAAAQILGSFLDRRRAYEALRASEEGQRRAMEALRTTQAQLVQTEKMASLGMLVAGIAHEINTPVGAINSMHDTLVRAVAKLRERLAGRGLLDGPEARALTGPLAAVDEANRVIQSGTARVTNIVRRLRSFARLDEAEIKRVDLHEGLEDTLTLAHHELKHDVTVVRNYGEVPPIACYPGRLNQVFLNVLINARQAMPAGGTITVSTWVADGKAHVAFRDTGVGIAPDHLARIFDPGFTTKGVGVGTGLGLAICYQIMQDHRGEIRVESEVGRGSTFTVVIPMDLDRILGVP